MSGQDVDSHGDADTTGRPPVPLLEAGGERSTLALLKQIQAGGVDPQCIGLADRRQIVSYLMGDGYATAEIAQILKVSDRSIERDKKAIRESNAIGRDPRLVEQMVGRLVSEAELAIQRIRKAARDKQAPPPVRIDAEQRCYQIVSDLVQSLQRLGYLPTATQKVEADLTHHVGDVPGLEEMQAEVQRLKQLTQDPGGSVPAELVELENQLTRAGLAAKVEQLAADAQVVAEPPGDDDGSSEQV